MSRETTSSRKLYVSDPFTAVVDPELQKLWLKDQQSVSLSTR